MSLFQCDNCGCVENTACTGGYHMKWKDDRMPADVAQSYRKELGLAADEEFGNYCCVCSPVWFTDEGEYGLGPIPKDKITKEDKWGDALGVWHGKFPREFWKKGTLFTDQQGNVSLRKRGRVKHLDEVMIGEGENFNWREANGEG